MAQKTYGIVKSLGNVYPVCRRKKVSAMCAAPSVLAGPGSLEGKIATCHPDFESKMRGTTLSGESVTDAESIISGQGLGATFDFAFEIAKTPVGNEKVQQMKKSICYRSTLS